MNGRMFIITVQWMIHVWFTNFICQYLSFYNECFPLIITSSSLGCKQPWMTSALLNSCRTKNKLYKSFIKHPTEQNKSAFISYRNGFSKLKMAAKKSYYNNLFSKCSLHKTWNLIESLIGHKTGFTDNTFSFFDDNDQLLTPCEVANKFNQHFSSIGKRITDNIPASINDSFHSFLNQPQLQSMSFLPTSPLEIIKFAHSLNTSHSCDIDNIDPCIAHEFISLIAEPLSSIFNCSFRTLLFL